VEERCSMVVVLWASLGLENVHAGGIHRSQTELSMNIIYLLFHMVCYCWYDSISLTH